MAEYIKREAVLALIQDDRDVVCEPTIELKYIRQDIMNLPIPDVVEVIRCADCKSWQPGLIDDCDNFNPPMCKWIGSVRRANDFCSYGERKAAQDKTCGTCKHFPPANEWPCVDCDMSIHDRWED